MLAVIPVLAAMFTAVALASVIPVVFETFVAVALARLIPVVFETFVAVALASVIPVVAEAVALWSVPPSPDVNTLVFASFVTKFPLAGAE
jgi:hypothetical protein